MIILNIDILRDYRTSRWTKYRDRELDELSWFGPAEAGDRTWTVDQQSSTFSLEHLSENTWAESIRNTRTIQNWYVHFCNWPWWDHNIIISRTACIWLFELMRYIICPHHIYCYFLERNDKLHGERFFRSSATWSSRKAFWTIWWFTTSSYLPPFC